MVYDQAGGYRISNSIQLLAGRLGQEYNIRKNRKGAFWQDRYHATAVETGEHLMRCIIYIDLNMVRTGTIDYPSPWRWCGYNEIQNPRLKTRLIDYEKLRRLVDYESYDVFQAAHKQWVEDLLAFRQAERESQWTESIAVGSNNFVNKMLSQLGPRVKGRSIIEIGRAFQIREESGIYNALFNKKNDDIAPEKAHG